MTDILKGIPQLTPTNENFQLGRKAATDLVNAGPGHHTVVEFDQTQANDLKSYTNGARYVAKSNSTIKVARRSDKQHGVIKVYIINEN